MAASTLSGTGRVAQRLASLERTLAFIRWFGIAFAVFQITQYRPTTVPAEAMPSFVRPAGLAATGIFAAANTLVMALLRRPRSERTWRRAGLTMFALDTAFLWSVTWLFAFEQYGATWVILFVLSIEGAFRYELRGALAPVLLGILIEPLRDLYAREAYGYELVLTGITFRLGVWSIIALASGAMAKRLAAERGQAEHLADREAQALAELHGLHQVLLAGVSANDLSPALQSMVERIGADLGYSSLYVLVQRSDGRLHPVAQHGLPPDALSMSIAPDEGISGAVFTSGRPRVSANVAAEPEYFVVDPETTSQITVPILAGAEVVGVLSAESRHAAAFGEEDRIRMERLAAYMAVVIQNARLLATERAAVERLKDLDQMKSDFVAITSHELRTPLTAMRGFIKTLRRPDLEVEPGELAEFLGILDRQSDRLARLVEDLLIVSRIDAGALHLRMEHIDVKDTLTEMLYELGPRASRVRLVVDADLPRVISDGQRMGQIARNLVENALKFSPPEEDVRLTAVRDSEHLLIEVADKGPGISAEEIGKIFERFHQVGGSLRRRAEGFGLGLYITQRLVQALGGGIEVESDPGRGTTFRVRLPLASAEDGEVETTA